MTAAKHTMTPDQEAAWMRNPIGFMGQTVKSGDRPSRPRPKGKARYEALTVSEQTIEDYWERHPDLTWSQCEAALGNKARHE